MNKSATSALLLAAAVACSQLCAARVHASQNEDVAKSQLRAEKIVATLTKIIVSDDDEELRMKAIDALVALYQAYSIEKVQDMIVDALLELVEDVENDRKVRAKSIQGILVIMEELDEKPAADVD